MISKFAITLCSLFAWLALPAVGRAFTVKSGLTDGCHEKVTVVAYLQTQIQAPSDLELYVPDGPWEEVADYLLRDANYQPRSRSEKFFLFSLLTGVRAPDNEGFSLSNISTLRAIHANPHDQYHHCLRSVEDDYVEGDEVAANGCHDTVLAQLGDAANELMKESEKQIGKVPFTLDQYGTFDVDVWLVAYHVGRAAHALEDSFTHTLRTQNLRGIIHVMNYAEAIGGTLREERDGLPHSSATDGCELITTEHAHPANRDRVFAAEEAVADLLRAAAPILSGENTEAEVSGVLDKWASYVPGAALGYPEGCIKDNDYCNSSWLELAKLHPSGPILGCGLSTGTSRPALGCTVLGLLALGLVVREAQRAARCSSRAEPRASTCSSRAQKRETGARS